MGCGVYWQQLREVERVLGAMEKRGIPFEDPTYQVFWKERGGLLAQVGKKFPRKTTLLGVVTGLSPGVIKIWHDVECGWMSEARERRGAHPVYKSVTDEVAFAIIEGKVTPELERDLLAPDEYLGE